MEISSALALLRRGCVECHTEEELRAKLSSGRALRVKLGVDPTSPDLHLGHTVVLSRLRAFQDLGHVAVLVIGDFTARVGDPSGRDATRPSLDAGTILANAATYQEQAFKVLDRGKTELRFNSEWLEPFIRKELFACLQRCTVGRLLQREDFAARSGKGLPITLLEILYPIFQGYDSVAVRADVELGGNDQLFNLLMGRQMQKDAGQPPQVALTLPLLVGLDGSRKMSKSYGNAIALNDSPRDMFGKLMRVSDELMFQYCELLTQEDTAALRSRHPMQAKKALAESLTSRFHGPDAARGERDYFERTFSKRELPEDVPAKEVRREGRSWSQLLACLELAPSRKEAQRLIAQGAFRIDGVPVQEDRVAEDCAGASGCVRTLQVGRHKFLKVRLLP